MFHQFTLLVGWIRLGHSIWSGWVTHVSCVPSDLSLGWVDQVGTLNLVRLSHSGRLCSITFLCWLGGSGWDTQFGLVGSLTLVGLVSLDRLVHMINLGWVTEFVLVGKMDCFVYGDGRVTGN